MTEKIAGLSEQPSVPPDQGSDVESTELVWRNTQLAILRHPKLTSACYVLSLLVLVSGPLLLPARLSLIIGLGATALFWFITFMRMWTPQLHNSTREFSHLVPTFLTLAKANSVSSSPARAYLHNCMLLFGKPLTVYLTALASSECIQFAARAFSSSDLNRAVLFAIISGLVPAATSFALTGLFRESIRKSYYGRTSRLKTATRFLAERGPYLGCYLGFLTTLITMSFSPGGVGSVIAAWLYNCLSDANIAAEGSKPSAVFSIAVSTILCLLIFKTLGRLAVRFSAAFQLFTTRIFINQDVFLEALLETVNVRSTLIHVPHPRPALQNITGILSWLTTCYLALFSLVVFCPPPLGDTILNWLWSCLRDAHMEIRPQDHLNLRIFLGSICAGYGAVPVAVMSCAFLTNRKPGVLMISSQGILFPNSASNMAGFSPLKMWSQLRSVSLANKGKQNETLVLSFNWWDTMKLKTTTMASSELAAFLLKADEYADNCKFSSEVIELREHLLAESKINALVQTGNFSSTIFSPLAGGDHFASGRYRIVRKLSSKALSTVYLARDQKNHHVVIKEFVMPSSARERDRMLTNFHREFTLLKTLKHEAIAGIIDMFEENDARYIVLEYIHGTDLRTKVETRGPRDENTVGRWAVTIAEILTYLHEQNPAILHRDLTPDNLMEDRTGQIRLIDFGAAHQFMEGVTGTLIGKQCYIAPEQLRGSPSPGSDIYSFGCTLNFLLTGKDPVALRQSDLREQPTISLAMAQLIFKCTAFDENQRYQSFREVLVELKSVRSAQHRALTITRNSDA